MKSSIGLNIAEILTGAWRSRPPAVELPANRSDAARMLLATGGGALVWRKLEATRFPPAEFISELKQAYRKHLAEAAAHDFAVKDIFKRLRAAGIEPLLFKGWALARLYPDAGLRPYGDIDLWLSPSELAAAYASLPCGDDYTYCVELHTAFYRQYERTLGDLFEQSQLVRLDDVDIRIPSAEDHLRFICLHFLSHGAWRPIWLCDIALLIESRAADFDWDRCLGGHRKYAQWVLSVIALTSELLDADVTGVPFDNPLPRWLKPAVLAQWERGPGMSFAEKLSCSLPRTWRRPLTLPKAFKEHWRNPIQASVEMNAWFNDRPRGPLQVVAGFSRVSEFARHFGREIRRN